MPKKETADEMLFLELARLRCKKISPSMKDTCHPRNLSSASIVSSASIRDSDNENRTYAKSRNSTDCHTVAVVRKPRLPGNCVSPIVKKPSHVQM